MLPLASEKPGGPDMLLTASADGTLAVWDPSRTQVRGADREVAARHAFKAHDSGVTVRGTAAAPRPVAARWPALSSVPSAQVLCLPIAHALYTSACCRNTRCPTGPFMTTPRNTPPAARRLYLVRALGAGTGVQAVENPTACGPCRL